MFGEELVIKDGFTKALNDFSSSIKNAKSDMESLKGSSNSMASSFTDNTATLRSQASTLAEIYRKQGMGKSDASKRAWEEVKKNANSANNQIVKTTENSSDKIKNSWYKSLDGIGNKFKSISGSIQTQIQKANNSIAGMFTKITMGYASFQGGKALLSNGIDSASSYQNAKMFIDSTFQDGSSDEKYKWAVKNSKETPFTETEVAMGLGRAKSLGLNVDEKNFKLYEDLGSFAKITGTGDLSSAIDAISDARGGEFERFQTITGVKRAQLEQYAEDNNMKKFSNKKGQVTDVDALDKVIEAYMGEKGISGMTTKYAGTFQGRLSTMKGNVENALAKFMGIQEDGAVKSGSLFERLSGTMEKFIDKITVFSDSQSFVRLQEKIESLGDSLVNGFSFIIEHPDLITKLLALGIGIKLLGTVSNAVNTVSNLTRAIKSLESISKVTSLIGKLSGLLTPMLSPLAIIIGLTMGIASILKPDGILHKGIESLLGAINPSLVEKFNSGTKWIVDKLNWLVDKILGVFGFDTSGIKVWSGENANAAKGIDGSSMNAADHMEDTEYNRKWFPENFKDINEGFTAKDAADKGSYKYSETKYESTPQPIVVNNSFGDVHETADVDEVADSMVKKLTKYANNRNNLK